MVYVYTKMIYSKFDFLFFSSEAKKSFIEKMKENLL